MVTIQVVSELNLNEIKQCISAAFNDTSTEADKLFEAEGNGQDLEQWLSVESMTLPTGVRVEARNDENNLIGFAYANVSNPITWPDGHKIELFVLAVIPEWRKQGIGRQLVQTIEKEARSLGGQSLLVNVHVFQTDVHEFYKRSGFEEIGTLKHYYANGDAKFFMKNL